MKKTCGRTRPHTKKNRNVQIRPSTRSVPCRVCVRVSSRRLAPGPPGVYLNQISPQFCAVLSCHGNPTCPQPSRMP